jgi:hypothetical protein
MQKTLIGPLTEEYAQQVADDIAEAARKAFTHDEFVQRQLRRVDEDRDLMFRALTGGWHDWPQYAVWETAWLCEARARAYVIREQS